MMAETFPPETLLDAHCPLRPEVPVTIQFPS